jgi:BTB/POZ domain-containing protein 7
VYLWAREPHGSALVRRHCVHLVAAHFMRCTQHGLVTDMDESLLVEVLRSDYVQAGELDILQTVLKWGEHALCRRMEEREPNILSGR